MGKIIVFDFDGTIADTIPVTMNIIKKFAAQDFDRDLNDEQMRELRDKPIPEIFKVLKISIIKLPFIARKIGMELNKEIGKIKPFPGIENLLKKLKKLDITLGIVSSNNVESIKKFLDQNNLRMFDFIYTNSKVFGKSSSLKRVINNYKNRKEDMIYIGDEIRDIEAARKVGIKIISVTWGVNSKEKLRAYSPDCLVDSPKEIMDLTVTKNMTV